MKFLITSTATRCPIGGVARWRLNQTACPALSGGRRADNRETQRAPAKRSEREAGTT